MGARYVIVVDDVDRADAPDTPWTASLATPQGDTIGTGFGATVAGALTDLLANSLTWEREVTE